MPLTHHLCTLVMAALTVIMITEACFITNCPPGGKKRNFWALNSNGNNVEKHYKKCTSCGPGDLGNCFGPNLCCGSGIGCFFNTAESAVCGTEDQSRVPCSNHVEKCNTVERGQCALQNYCCNEKGECAVDSMCLLPSSSAKKEPLADRKDSRFLSDSLAKLSSSQKLAWSRDLFPGKGGDLSEEKMPLLRVRFRQSPEFMSRTDDIERKMDPKSEAFARDADFQEYQELFPYALRS